MTDNAVTAAWTQFIRAQSEGITDIRSMERALAAAEKYIVADVREIKRLRDALQRIYEFDRTDMGDGGYFLPGVCGRIASEALEPEQAYDSAPTDPSHGGKVWKE